MFRIKDFSKLSQVSIKALHHYDELGLFKPLYVDELSGYRYYMIEQMPRLNRILVLKDLGFSLEQIALMLDGELSSTQLKEMLESRRTQVLQQIRAEQEKLTRRTLAAYPRSQEWNKWPVSFTRAFTPRSHRLMKHLCNG